ncbi:MAG: hypothetical protein V4574_00240 [Pseudomonadota bacterium]
MLLLIAALVLLGTMVAAQFAGSAQTRAVPRGIRVLGTLKLVVPRPPSIAAAAAQTGALALPDQKVTLRRVGGGDVGSAVTMLDGRFELRAPSSGSYQICWDIAGATGCSKALAVGKIAVSADDVLAQAKAPLLWGIVLTGDDRPCWVNDSFFGLDVATIVRAGAKKVRANVRGEYAIPGLAAGNYTVTANCEKAQVSAPAALGAAGLRLALALPNRAPRLVTAFVSDGAKALTHAAPGATVRLAAETRDPDGDAVTYMWRTLGGDGTLGGSTGPNEKWKLSAEPGFDAAYVVARDGKGGYAYRRISLRSGSPDLTFSGRVVDEVTGQPIVGAAVSVGTGSATTNATGWFTTTTKPRADDRYVLNIASGNYAPVSRVFDKDVTDTTYEMIRAQVQTLPATGVIRIADTRSSGPCGNPQGSDRKRREQRLVKPSVYRFPGDEGRKNARGDAALLAAAARAAPCDPRGIQLTIPAGALVDSAGNAPATIRAMSATLNPGRRAIPGDYQAQPASGPRAELFSYGAAYASFTDTAGRKLNLRAGTTAQVHVPVSAEARAAAPPTIALWSYDNVRGIWVEEGTATLQNTPSGWAYVGSTRHFSELNMDVAGLDPAHATCARVELGAGSFVGWTELTLRAYVSYGGAPPPQVKETLLDGHQYHAIFRIPFNTGFANTLRLELRGKRGDGTAVVLLDNIVDANAAPFHAMTTPDLWPDTPYGDCTPLVLTEEPGVVPTYGDTDAFGRPAFLAGVFGGFNPADGEAQATAYYAALDSPTPKPTLGDWWQANGFDINTGLSADPAFVQVAYLNHNDLGFGRNMHCLPGAGGKLACYVTNYGLPDQKDANADAALAQTGPGATVAMEYDPAGGDEAVQFYVYGGAATGSPRLKFADLDGFGPKPVPFLCQVCHGGGPYLTGSNKVEFAHFREFDLPSFRYPGGKHWDYGEATGGVAPSNADFDKFAILNHYVRDTNVGNEIARTIDDWYSGSFSGTPDAPPAAPGWGTVSDADYRLVYGQTCRTCHIARDYPQFVGTDGFDTFKTDSIGRVCGSGPAPRVRVMPNASITYRNFWKDTARVHAYESLVAIPIDSCDD